jgi:hypothetical protein
MLPDFSVQEHEYLHINITVNMSSGKAEVYLCDRARTILCQNQLINLEMAPQMAEVLIDGKGIRIVIEQTAPRSLYNTGLEVGDLHFKMYDII